MRILFRAAAFVLLLMILVELGMRATGISKAMFAYPSEIFVALKSFFAWPEYSKHMVVTVSRTLFAFTLAIPLGLLIGVLVSRFPLINRGGTLTVDFLRSIPATALIPVFIFLFGNQDLSKIAIGCFTGTLSIAMAVIVGYSSLGADRALVADSIGLKGVDRIFLYELPESYSTIFVGLRSAASLCLILVVVAEMFGGTTFGLGRLIQQGRVTDAVPLAWASILLLGVVGYGMNYGLVWAERRLQLRFGLNRS